MTPTSGTSASGSASAASSKSGNGSVTTGNPSGSTRFAGESGTKSATTAKSSTRGRGGYRNGSRTDRR